jgi:hypothetical protein
MTLDRLEKGGTDAMRVTVVVLQVSSSYVLASR